MAKSLRLVSIFLVICLFIICYWFFLFGMKTLHSFDDAKWVAQTVSQVLHQPVTIATVKSHLHGLKPEITLDNVVVYNQHAQPTLQVKKIGLSIDLLTSLLKWRLTPGDIEINGMTLKIAEVRSGVYSVNDIPFLEIDLKTQDSWRLRLLMDCFLTNGLKHLQDIAVIVNDKTGQPLLALTKVNLTEKSGLLVHHFTGQAFIAAMQPPIAFDGKIVGSYLWHKLLSLNMHVLGNNIKPSEINLVSQLIPVVSIENGTVSLDANIFLNRKALTMKGNAVARQILFQKEEQKFQLDRLSSHIELKHQQGFTELVLNQLHLIHHRHLVPIHQLTLTSTPNQQDIRLDNVPIAETAQFVRENHLISSSQMEMLVGLAPTGNVKNFFLHRSTNKKQFSLSGLLEQLSVKPYQQVPGLTNISGKVELFPNKGRLQLNTAQSTFDYRPMFRQHILMQSLKGQASWQRDGVGNWSIKLKNVALNNQDGSATGFMNILLPANLTNPYIQSRFTFEMKNLTQASLYYPVSIMPSGVVSWLDSAIKGGRISRGLFLLNGNMNDFPFDQEKGKFLISADLAHGVLDFQKSWPKIDHLRARLVFEGRKMQITSKHAATKGIKITAAEATIANLESPLLHIKGQMGVFGQEQTVLLNQDENPLTLFLKDPRLASLRIDGKWQLGLNLQLPLSKDARRPQFQGLVNLDKVTIKANEANFSLNELRGSLQFADDALKSPALSGLWLANPFQLAIGNKQTKDGKLTQMKLSSRIDIADMQKIMPFAVLKPFQGTTQVNANYSWLQTTQGETNTTLALDSDLIGVCAQLPSPLGKLANMPLALHLRIENRPSQEILRFKYGEIANGVVAYKKEQQHMQFEKGQIQFGNQLAELPQYKGLQVKGYLPTVNLSVWNDLLSKDNKQATTMQIQPFIHLISQVDLNTNQLTMGNLTFTAASIMINKVANGLAVALKSKETQGQAIFPALYPATPLKINLQNLTIKDDQQLASQLSLHSVPALDLTIADFFYKEKQIKNLELKLRKNGENIIIKRLAIKEPFIDLTASGTWREMHGRPITELNGSFSSQNIGALLNQWHLTDNVVEGEGKANFQITWQNTLFNPEMKNLSGFMNLQFNRGRIIKLSQQANIGMDMGKVLTLFNLETLQRRLKLDFSDLTEPGFSFDEMQGTLQFKNGDIYTENSSFTGPVASVSVKGKIGMMAKNYQLRLTINPNVTSSLPVVATLTAGPVVGAVTWIADKIFSRQVKHITEIHYDVTGSWDNPTIKSLSDNR